MDFFVAVGLVEDSHALGDSAHVTVRDAAASVGLDRITHLTMSSGLVLRCALAALREDIAIVPAPAT